MKKKFSRILSMLLAVTLALSTLPPVGALAAEPQYSSKAESGRFSVNGQEFAVVYNDFLAAYVSERDGSFTVLPKAETFDAAKPGSFATFQIDGSDYLFGNRYDGDMGFLISTEIEDNVIVSYWNISGYVIAQHIAITPDEKNENSYAAKIAYAAEYFGTGDSTIAARILIDTPDTEGTETVISPVPEAMFLNDRTPRPYLLLQEEGKTPPNKLVFGNFDTLCENPSQYTVVEGTALYDMAAALYFGSVDLQEAENILDSNEGALAVFTTSYGYTDLMGKSGFVQTVGGIDEVLSVAASSELITPFDRGSTTHDVKFTYELSADIDPASLSIKNSLGTDITEAEEGEEVFVKMKTLYPDYYKIDTYEYDDMFAPCVSLYSIEDDGDGEYFDLRGQVRLTPTLNDDEYSFTMPVPDGTDILDYQIAQIEASVGYKDGVAGIGLFCSEGMEASIDSDCPTAAFWGDTVTVSITPSSPDNEVSISGGYYDGNSSQGIVFTTVQGNAEYSFVVPHDVDFVSINISESGTYRINKTVAPYDPDVSFGLQLAPINGMLRAASGSNITLDPAAFAGLGSYANAKVSVYNLATGEQVGSTFENITNNTPSFEMPAFDVEVRLELEEYHTITVNTEGTAGNKVGYSWYPEHPKEGDMVTFYVTKWDGSEVDDVSAEQHGGGAIALTTSSPGYTYSFSMPNANVDITVTATAPIETPAPLHNIYIKPLAADGRLQWNVNIWGANPSQDSPTVVVDNELTKTMQTRTGTTIGWWLYDVIGSESSSMQWSDWTLDKAYVVTASGEVIKDLKAEQYGSGQTFLTMPDEDIYIVLEGGKYPQEVTLNVVQLVGDKEIPLNVTPAYIEVTHGSSSAKRDSYAFFGDKVEVYTTAAFTGAGASYVLDSARISQGNAASTFSNRRDWTGEFSYTDVYSFTMGAEPIEITLVYKTDNQPVQIKFDGESDGVTISTYNGSGTSGGRDDSYWPVMARVIENSSLYKFVSGQIFMNFDYSHEYTYDLYEGNTKLTPSYDNNYGYKSYSVSFAADVTDKTYTVVKTMEPSRLSVDSVSMNHTNRDKFEYLTLTGSFSDFNIGEQVTNITLRGFFNGAQIESVKTVTTGSLTKISDTELRLTFDASLRAEMDAAVYFSLTINYNYGPGNASRNAYTTRFWLSTMVSNLHDDFMYAAVVQFDNSNGLNHDKRLIAAKTSEDLLQEIAKLPGTNKQTLLLLSSQDGFTADNGGGTKDYITSVTLKDGDFVVKLNNLTLDRVDDDATLKLGYEGDVYDPNININLEASGFKASVGSLPIFYPVTIPKVADLLDFLDTVNVDLGSLVTEQKTQLFGLIGEIQDALQEELPFDLPADIAKTFSDVADGAFEILDEAALDKLTKLIDFLEALAGFNRVYVNISLEEYLTDIENYDRLKKEYEDNNRLDFDSSYSLVELRSPMYEAAGKFTDLIGYDGFQAYFDAIRMYNNGVRFSGKLNVSLPKSDEPLAYLEIMRLDINTSGNFLGTGLGFDGIEGEGQVHVPPISSWEGAGGRAYVNTYDHVYEFEFNADIYVIKANGLLYLKPVTYPGSGGKTIPFLDSFYFKFSAIKGIPLIPNVPVADLRGLSGGIMHLNSLLTYDFSKQTIPALEVIAGATFGLLEVLSVEMEITIRIGSLKASMEGLKVGLSGMDVEVIDSISFDYGLKDAPQKYNSSTGTWTKRVTYGYLLNLSFNIAKGIELTGGDGGEGSSKYSLSDIFKGKGNMHIGMEVNSPEYWLEITSGSDILQKIDPVIGASGELTGDLALPEFVPLVGGKSLTSVQAIIAAAMSVKNNSDNPFELDGKMIVILKASAMGIDVMVKYDLTDPKNIQISPKPFSVDLASANDPYNKTFEFGGDTTHGSMQVGSNIKTVASSNEFFNVPTNGIMGFAAFSTTYEQPILQMNKDGSVHKITVKDDGNACMVEVTALRSDIRVFAPDGSPYPLSFMPDESSAEQAGAAYNAMVYSDANGIEKVLLVLGTEHGIWTIQSSEPFTSTILSVSPPAKVTELDADADSVDFKVENLSAETYVYTVLLNRREQPDSAVLTAYTLASNVSFTKSEGESGISINIPTNTEFKNGLPSGDYYPTVVVSKVTGTGDNAVYEPVAYLNGDTCYENINTKFEILFPNYLNNLNAFSGGNETLKLTFSHTTGIDGYLVNLYDAQGVPVMTGGADADGNPVLSPLSFDITSGMAENNEFELYLGGLTGGNEYIAEVVPYVTETSDNITIDTNDYEYDGVMSVTLFGNPKRTAPTMVAVSTPPVITMNVSGGNIGSYGGFPTIYTNGSAVLTVDTDEACDIEIGSNFGSNVLVSGTGTTLSLDTSTLSYLTAMNLLITATDAEGDVATQVIQLMFDDTAPALTLDYPEGDAYKANSSGSFTIIGLTDPGQTVFVTGGASTTAGADGSFSLSGQITGDSADVIISATDASGNTVSMVAPVIKTDNAHWTGGDGGGYVPPTQPSHHYDNDNSSYTQGSGVPLVHIIQKNLSQFSSVKVDGSTITKDKQYKAENGTTVITLYADYLDTLSIGKHTLFVLFNDGVVVTTEFTIVEGEPVTPVPKPWVNPFKDVNESAWYYGNVEYVYTHGLMTGTSTNPMLFSPDMTTTRGMVVTVLYHYAGSPGVSGFTNPFDDVAEGKWYTHAVKWAAENGIVSGYGNGRFGPDDSITRQDLAVILNNFAKINDWTLPEARDYSGFNDDADIANYAKEAIERFFKANIINGKHGNIFDPKGEATRAELAAMITRLLETVKEK